MQGHEEKMSDRETNLLRSMTETGWKFYLWVGCLMAVVFWGLYAHSEQSRSGLIVTGQRDQIAWGMCIVNFVFFLSISIAGTLISAVLRLTDTGWRRPITRMAESITLAALFVGPPIILLDLGRPDRILYLFRYARIESPIVWDVLVINTYLIGCMIYFYLLLVPDLVLLAARPDLSAWRRRLYRVLSAGWEGNPNQVHMLEKSISIMSVTLLPVAILTHSVLAWIFSTTLRPGWSSSIMGPYFVIAAIYGGCACVILSMYVLRRVLHLEDYLESVHFRNLGLLLFTFSLLYIYFNFNEYLTIGYSPKSSEKLLIARLFWGEDAPLFWGVTILGVLVPAILLAVVLLWKQYREFLIPGVAFASGLVIVGAWAKRYLLVVPTLSIPFLPAQGLPADWTHYTPSWVEWSITAAAVAGFLLIFTFLAKLFPMVSIWETRAKEPAEETVEHTVPAMQPRPYMPPPLSVLLLAAFGMAAVSAHAQQSPPAKNAKPIVMSLESETLAPDELAAASSEGVAHPQGKGPSRIYLYAERVLSPLIPGGKGKSSEDQLSVRPMAITAKLRDVSGAPVAYRPVGFALESSFGTLLQLGKVATDSEGRARLVLRDRRCGIYPFQAVYDGDQSFQRGSVVGKVDFGPCAAPALPAQSLFITPYSTPPIALASALFIGTVWGVFFYVFGYRFFWRMHPRWGGRR